MNMTNINDDEGIFRMHNKWREALCVPKQTRKCSSQNKAYVDDYNGYDNYKIARICGDCPVKGECLADALMIRRT